MDLKLPKLDGIKDRLGFSDQHDRASRANRHDVHDEDYGFDEQGEDGYGTYDDYGYDDADGDGFADDFGEYGYDADHDDTHVDESPRGAHVARPVDYGAASMPRLVTADDVRAHTQYNPPADTEPYQTRAQRLGMDSHGGTAELTRSEGLNSLFASTVASPAPSAATSSSAPVFEKVSVPSPSSWGSVPPVTPPSSSAAAGAYGSSDGAAEGVPSVVRSIDDSKVIARAARILTVLKPEKYEEAERVAKILKAGDVAVLSLRNTPVDLSKRILDFSFGAASALDARVEFLGDQVFAISRGAALSDDERTRLRNQGLM